MPLITDGFNTYVPREDGTKDYGTLTNFEINGKRVYNFDPKTGILQISMNLDSLENLLKCIGEIPKEGRDLELPIPLSRQVARFKGVKKIESMTKIKEGEYMMEVKEAMDIPKKEGLINKIKNKIGAKEK